MLPPTAANKGIRDTRIVRFPRQIKNEEQLRSSHWSLALGYPKTPSSLHRLQAMKVPTHPLRTSPCPPHRLKPPSISTSIVPEFFIYVFDPAFSQVCCISCCVAGDYTYGPLLQHGYSTQKLGYQGCTSVIAGNFGVYTYLFT